MNEWVLVRFCHGFTGIKMRGRLGSAADDLVRCLFSGADARGHVLLAIFFLIAASNSYRTPRKFIFRAVCG
jgi:hypothetical protein